MKKLLGLILMVTVIGASVSGEAARKTDFSGSQTQHWANDVDSISFTLSGANKMFFSNISADRAAAWDKVVGIFNAVALVPFDAIDSLGKRDTVIVTLKAIGMNDLRIDTLQTDTLVVIREKSEIKYDFTNFIQNTVTTHFALDSGGVASDSGTTVNTTTIVTTTNRFAFELSYLTLDVYWVDSVISTNDSVTAQIQWFMEFIDE